MKDKRNTELFKVASGLPMSQKIRLLNFLFGWENECKHFHNGVEAWLEINDVNKEGE